MPFETPFAPAVFDGTIDASVHEHGGAPPTTIIRTNQRWSVHVRIENTGIAVGMISGKYHLHLLLESIGPGPELSLIDPGDHVFDLTPASPVYNRHVDVSPGRVSPGVYKLVVWVRYIEPTGRPGPMSAHMEISPPIEFFNP